jgi:predicted nucleotidyltransferase
LKPNQLKVANFNKTSLFFPPTVRIIQIQWNLKMPNKTPTLEELKALSPQFFRKIPYLKMLVLFGSRATGKTHADSDWDFATLYDEEIRKTLSTNPFAWFEVPTIISQILQIPDNKVDVVELNSCSPIIAHFVARDGKLIYEKEPGEFNNFRKRALKSDLEMKEIRKTLREKIEAGLQRWGV